MNHIHTYNDDGKESVTVSEGSRCDYGFCRERSTHLAVVRYLALGEQTVDIRPVCDDHAEQWQGNVRVTLVPFRGEA